MPKLVKFRRRHAKKNPGEPRRNPALSTDIVHFLLPGFAAFAAARVTTRMAAVQISKRYPKAAKHAGAIAAVGAFGAAWWGAHRVKYLEKFHDAIVVGAGLAALQSLAQIYIPKLNALIGDPCPTALPAPQVARQIAAPQQVARPAQVPLPAGFKPTTANEWYTYNDSFDAGSYKGKVEVPAAQANPPPSAQANDQETQISELLDNSDLQLDNSDLGLS